MKTERRSRANQILAATRRRANRVISNAVEDGLQVMLSKVPVREGHLESTCQKRDDGSGHGMLMAGGPSQIDEEVFVDYEKDVEFGTHKQEAQPFFRPAVEAARRKIKEEMRVTDK